MTFGSGTTAAEILISGGIAIVLLMFVSLSSGRILSSAEGGILYRAVWSIVAVAALLFGAMSVVNISDYASRVIVAGTPVLLLRIIFISLCAYLGYIGPMAIRKIGVVVAFLTVTLALVLLAMSAPSFRWGNISEMAGEGVQTGGILSAFGALFAPCVVGIMLMSADPEGGPMPTTSCALLGGGVSVLFALLCLLNVVLVLGGRTMYQYPYSTAVSTVTAGKLFARLEGFVYFMLYACEAVKGAAGIALAVRMTKLISPALHKRGCCVCAAAALILLLSYM